MLINTKKLEYYDSIARTVASNSHDAETKVGAILIHSQTGAILSTGYNGFIRGANDEKLPNTRPDKYPYMVHAEPNLLFNCARHGISTDGSILYCTLSPCINCARSLWQSGIKEVYFKDKYRDFEKGLAMLDLDLKLSQREDGFYHMVLEPK